MYVHIYVHTYVLALIMVLVAFTRHRYNLSKINEVKELADAHRAMERTRRAFMKVTKCVSWEEATRKYPDHVTEDRLKEFSKVSLDNTIPPSFIAFCQSAIEGTNPRIETSIQLLTGTYRYVNNLVKLSQQSWSSIQVQILILILSA